MSRSSEKRLRDILERIAAAKRAERLLDDAEADGDAAAADTAFDAILYDLVVIGEAVKSLPRSMKDLHPEVPWTSIAGMRDVLATSTSPSAPPSSGTRSTSRWSGFASCAGIWLTTTCQARRDRPRRRPDLGLRDPDLRRRTAPRARG